MPVTIRRAYRNVLRREVLTELTGIGDVYIALDSGEWIHALALRRRYEDCMRLLDDLGWREDDPAREFAITTDPSPLMRVLARLNERANETIEQYVDDTSEDRRAVIEATFVMTACSDVMVKLIEAVASEPLPEIDEADADSGAPRVP
jgi:hypothetical protein